jgi:hypothetical protein
MGHGSSSRDEQEPKPAPMRFPIRRAEKATSLACRTYSCPAWIACHGQHGCEPAPFYRNLGHMPGGRNRLGSARELLRSTCSIANPNSPQNSCVMSRGEHTGVYSEMVDRKTGGIQMRSGELPGGRVVAAVLAGKGTIAISARDGEIDWISHAFRHAVGAAHIGRRIAE